MGEEEDGVDVGDFARLEKAVTVKCRPKAERLDRVELEGLLLGSSGEDVGWEPDEVASSSPGSQLSCLTEAAALGEPTWSDRFMLVTLEK